MKIKHILRALAWSVAALSVPTYAADLTPGSFQLSYLGQQIVTSGTQFAGTTVGGLSGLDYIAASNSYIAISDDRSAINAARFYGLSLDISKFQRSATAGAAGVSFNSVTTIQQAGGGAFAPNTVDPESIRYDPSRNAIYWSNEGQRTAAGLQSPTVREMHTDGSYVRDFSVPAYYTPSGSTSGLNVGDKGVYNNLAFENLTISQDGKTLYTATENGLAQDTLPTSVNNGSNSRILSFDIATGQSGPQYVYQVAPVVLAPNPAGQFATNGLTDFISVGDRQFITIERSFATGAQTPGTPVTGNSIRLFYADARNATDVSSFESIAGLNVQAVSKTFLLDLSTLKNDDGSALALDNIEGITLGPQVNGKSTLLLVSDNNFSGTQFTQFVALQISPVPEPESYAMLLAGLALIGAIARRRR